MDTNRPVFIPAGTWEIDTALVWDLDQSSMFGEGSRTSIISQTAAGEHGIEFTTSPEASGVTKFGILERLRIIGVGASSTADGLYHWKVAAPSFAFLRVRDVYIRGFRYGVNLERVDNFSFIGCEFNTNILANVRLAAQTKTTSFMNCVNASPTSGPCWLIDAGGNASLWGCDTGNGAQHALIGGSFSARDSNFESIISDTYVKRSQAITDITLAAPGVVTSAAHGLKVGDRVSFTTTGTLPTGLVASTVYQVTSVPSVDTFSVGAVYPGSSITTSGSPTGDHTLRVHINGHFETTGIGFISLENTSNLGGSSTLPVVYFTSFGNFVNVGALGFGTGGGKLRRATPSATGRFAYGAYLASNRQSTGSTLDAAGQYELTGWTVFDSVRYDSGSTAVAGNRGLLQLGVGTGSNADRIGFMMRDGTAYQRAQIGIIETKTTTGDPAAGHEGRMVINTFDNTVKIYADGGWRTIASGW
jgi:hypothetical protein